MIVAEVSGGTKMKWVLIVVFALLIPHPASSKARKYHWKTGMLTFLTVETDQPTMAPQPNLAADPGMQVTQQTWTYQVEGSEGIYVVKIGPELLTTSSGVTIHYEIEGKTMHVDATVNGKKLKVKDLQIRKFTPR
jgi:hypothetical protein